MAKFYYALRGLGEYRHGPTIMFATRPPTASTTCSLTYPTRRLLIFCCSMQICPEWKNFVGLRRVVKSFLTTRLLSRHRARTATKSSPLFSVARGYVLPSSKPGVLKHALQLIMAGEFYIPARVLHPSSGYSLQFEQPLPPAVMSVGGEDFTARQREITLMLADGKSNKEIARELKVLECTVKLHVRSILRKLGVKNRIEAVLAAARAGYLRSETLLRPDLGRGRLPSTAGNGSG